MLVQQQDQLLLLILVRSYRMFTYKKIIREEITFIQRTDENGTVWSIPTDPTNSDYQEYLRSLEA